VPLTKKSVLVDKESRHLGRRLDRVVQSLSDMLPRAQVLGLFDHGCVQLNGATCVFPGQRAAIGDEVELRYDAKQIYHPRKQPRHNLGFEIVFEDRHLIVVNKPPELLTVPTIRGETNTLVAKVSEYVRHVSGGQQVFTAHRLDRGVSGLLVMGKSMEISQQIRDQFKFLDYAPIVFLSAQTGAGVGKLFKLIAEVNCRTTACSRQAAARAFALRLSSGRGSGWRTR